ncbi:peptidoglycan-associated lipoprotein Pal [Pararhodobacter aggregans]|uniref:Peptidoglycan-associated lipoprotein n=1 Tax=Pararhodobacter aggregans TaxID=404875 RepID=A0A2T7UJN9_9RHOB|nr:peptidoglycan-associated lipoprotein Pal [Pararhodobacter aggregans]PTW97554.1 peptidoglycan-associated lipoprotein [Pararhodobacter aggregans]PVE44884.1 peptidoglycan-associated lipoprotein Pal [Pararhodobacter aggregans]
MNTLTKAILVVAALALAACNNPRGGDGMDGGMGAGGGIASTALGDPNDPTSIAYFNETIGDTVTFTVDSSDLSPLAQNVLRTQASWLNRFPEYQILVEGHADERGTREYNVALGARRAARVQQFLIAEGVSAVRIRTVSYGKERPIEVCAEQRCWDANRRAVTVVSR